ncbi:MAG: hypothetical protein GX885_11610 [Methanomicrobiales archaeon]|nr:hypothetical protein [Methanomicrobiales archaeon]
MYDDESKCYTPHNFLDFCGFECRYNELTERYDVNGLASSTLFITSFEEEEFAVTVTRFLITLKAIAEINPQSEVRFIDVDMIIDELEEMEEDDEVLFTEEITEEQHNRYDLLTVAFLTFWLGFITSMVIL